MAEFAMRVRKVMEPEIEKIHELFLTRESDDFDPELLTPILEKLNDTYQEVRRNCDVLEDFVSKQMQAMEEEEKRKKWELIFNLAKDLIVKFFDADEDYDLDINDVMKIIDETVKGTIDTIQYWLEKGIDMYELLERWFNDTIKPKMQLEHLEQIQAGDEISWILHKVKDLDNIRTEQQAISGDIMEAITSCCTGISSKLEIIEDDQDIIKGKQEEIISRLGTFDGSSVSNNTLDTITHLKRIESDIDLIRRLLQTATSYSCYS